MPVNLTNSTDLIANSISLVDGNQLVDVKDLFLSKLDALQDIVGLPPETLNTLQKLADSINNDSNFYDTLVAELALKANISETYSRTYVDSLISGYDTKTESDVTFNAINTAL